MESLKVAFIFYYIVLASQCDGMFLGGSVSWYWLGGNVRFTYRLTWEVGTGPCGSGCTHARVNLTGSVSPQLRVISWCCSSGCNSKQKLHDVNYVTTSVSQVPAGWEQGEGSFSFTPRGHGQFEVSLAGLLWSTAANGPGRLVTTVDIRNRSDTGLPNASPIPALQPTIGVPARCNTTVTLPLVDPDADTVRCRLAEATECGSACTTIPGIQIDHNKCTVTIPATAKSGSYRLTVVAEDYPRSHIELSGTPNNINQPLSQTPLQVTIHVIPVSGGCSPIPVHTDKGSAFVFPPSGAQGGNLHTVNLASLSTTAAILSTSAGVTHTVSKVTGHPGTTRLDTRWWPTADQDGPAFTCVWGLQTNGITTEQHCFTAYVRDKDDCIGGHKCEHGGTCVDLYKRFTCQCLGGFTSTNCSARVSCKSSSPCIFGTCEERPKTLFCICSPGHTGSTCDTKIDNCSSTSCLNGGSCINTLNGSDCACSDAYTGRRCETSVLRTTLSHQKRDIQIMDAIKVSDHRKEEINLVVNNEGPPLWPVGVAFGGILVAALIGFGVWCCVAKRGKGSTIEPSEQWAKKPDREAAETPHNEKAIQSVGHNVTQMEANTGTQVSGGSPKILNIYQSSANDPHIHKCGVPSHAHVYHNTFM